MSNITPAVPQSPIPVVFIPGVMGSRLMFRNPFSPHIFPWDPDNPATMLPVWVGASESDKYLLFKSFFGEIYEVPPPSLVSRFGPQELKRGWAGVCANFYLLLLEDLRENLPRCPVYAQGYDWRQSNEDSGAFIATRVRQILKRHAAQQAILVTHSMGGIVARAACKFNAGFTDEILAVIHVAQPAAGASIAYRRFFSGCNDGQGIPGWALDTIAGSEWWEDMGLMSVLPGPLQLLPTNHYRDNAHPADWLVEEKGANPDISHSGPNSDMFSTYQTMGFPGILFGYVPSISGFSRNEWDTVLSDLIRNLALAKSFHDRLGLFAHPTTFVVASDGDPNTDVGFTGFTLPPFHFSADKGKGDETVPIGVSRIHNLP